MAETNKSISHTTLTNKAVSHIAFHVEEGSPRRHTFNAIVDSLKLISERLDKLDEKLSEIYVKSL